MTVHWHDDALEWCPCDESVPVVPPENTKDEDYVWNGSVEFYIAKGHRVDQAPMVKGVYLSHKVYKYDDEKWIC